MDLIWPIMPNLIAFTFLKEIYVNQFQQKKMTMPIKF